MSNDDRHGWNVTRVRIIQSRYEWRKELETLMSELVTTAALAGHTVDWGTLSINTATAYIEDGSWAEPHASPTYTTINMSIEGARS